MVVLRKYPSITVIARKENHKSITDIIEYPKELMDICSPDTDPEGLDSDYLFFTDGNLYKDIIVDLANTLKEDDEIAACLTSLKKSSEEVVLWPFLDKRSLLIKRDGFILSGGFDKDLKAYDIDLGLRLWVTGFKTYGFNTSKIELDERAVENIPLSDKFAIAYKNFSDDLLGALLSLLLDKEGLKNSARLDIDPGTYDISYGESNLKSESEKIDAPYNAFLSAVNSFIKDIPGLKAKRKAIQTARRRLDKSIFHRFGDYILDIYRDQENADAGDLGIEKILKESSRVRMLVISNEVVAKSMAGPGIRAYNISEQLSKHCDVTLLVPNRPDIKAGFKILKTDEDLLREYVDDSDIILTSGTTVAKYKFLKDCEKIMIFDLYDPYNIASLVEYENLTFSERMEANQKISKIINFQITRGDHFLCATERQKDLWSGMISALGRVKEDDNITSDPERLIDVVPFGMPDDEPLSSKKAIKGVVKGIEKEDFVILWGGGIYNWFDPLSLIRAMEIINESHPDIKLYFMGVKHPNPEVTELKMAGDAFELAKRLGLNDKTVFFNFGWVSYERRTDYLLDSDIGIITYPKHIETRFAFRTRILDYLWAELPAIASKGDYLSSMISRKILGISVDNSAAEIADAIIKLYEDKGFYCKCKSNITRIKENYRWKKVTSPLIGYCKDPNSRK